MKRISNTLLITLAAMTMTHAYANDSNVQNKIRQPLESTLHLLEPQYGFNYVVPVRDSVKAAMDQVLGFMEKSMPMDMENGRVKAGGFRLTSYEAGVMYAACEDASRMTGDSRYLSFTRTRLQFLSHLATTMMDSIKRNKNYDRQIRPMVLPGSLDDAGAMCAAYCRLALMENDGKPVKNLRTDNCMTINRYIKQVWRQYRIGNDSIFARNRPCKNSVWLDDMYMGCPSLAWYGALTADAKSIQEAVKQIKAFKSRMWVPEEKLFRHGWVEAMIPHRFFPWGRANGWALLTMCEVMDAIGAYEKEAKAGLAQKIDFEEEKAFILDLFRQHIEGLCRLQDKTGLWHQLLNEPSSYLETSASAIYTYCLAHAICEGWIGASAYGPQTLLAWNAVSRQINTYGQVENTCVGSGMGFDPAFYCFRPVHVMAAHGYGPVIWAGGEIIRLLESSKPVKNDSAILFEDNFDNSNN